MRACLAALMLFALAACAHKPPASDPVALAAYEEANDPLEPFNRAMFKADEGLDKVFVRPVIGVYRAIVPAGGRKGVDNFVNNLRSPITFVNDLLQGEVSRAGTTLGRLAVNTGVGFFGFFESIDDQPVDLIFMLLAPESAGADHLKALAKVSRLLRDRAMCDKLRGADGSAALYALLTQNPAQTNAA